MPNIRDLARARVVVVGDAMVDVWVHGRVDRISPEAPVPVFLEDRRQTRAGGAGNVVENLRALGCTVAYPYTVKGATKTRYVVNNQQIFRADAEDCSAIDLNTQQRSFQCATQQPCDVMILSDYAKGALPASLCQMLIRWANERGVKTIVDPKGKDWRKYKGADIITPNRAEVEASDENEDIICKAMLVTMGAEGMLLCTDYRSNEGVHIAATNSGPVDVTGAGDSVVAVLAAALAVGFDLEAAARLANAAAGVTVGKFGTAVCSIEELELAMARQTLKRTEEIIQAPIAEKMAELLEAKRPIVGFANGVFDLMHDGHRHFLRECKMNCDRLYVMINGDECVLTRKGRLPHDPFLVRMRNVQEYADNVCGFDNEGTLYDLMRNVKPDVIFKGEDYHGKPVTGGDLARIHWVARHPGFSSTIERAKAKA